MSSEEREDSLAAQAAAWVPPWERRREPPDRAFQAAAVHAADDVPPDAAVDASRGAAVGSAGGAGVAVASDVPRDAVVDASRGAAVGSAGGAAVAAAGDVPRDAVVDAPQNRPDGDEDEDEAPEPTEAEVGPELPLPDSVEEAGEEAPDDDEHVPVDAPVIDELSAGAAPAPIGAPAASGDAAAPGAGAGPVGGRGATGGAGAAPAGPSAMESDLTPVGGVAPAAAGESPAVTVPAQARGRRDGAEASGDGSARTPAVLDDADLAAALESIMLVVDEPVGELQLAQVLEQPVERIARTLEDISARYTAAGHGIDLRRVAGGWRLYTRPEYAHYVERFVLDGQSVRLTQAALETLSVVAYKQPVTRSRISAIRGVNCDGVMRTLVTRGLIEECGTEPETGAYLYRTTVLFLEKLGLNSVDELPPLAPFLPDDVEEVLDASG